MMVIYIKQETVEAQFMKKLSSTESELKKSVTYKKRGGISIFSDKRSLNQ